MNEIYRSFEGKLSPDQQEGYIVYESDSYQSGKRENSDIA